MRIVHINYVYDDDLADPDALLDRYHTLTEWSTALAASDSARVTVVQRFRRDASIARNGVDYLFRGDGAAGGPSHWNWPRRVHRAVVDAGPDVVHVNSLDFPIQAWLLRRRLPRSTAVIVQDHASGAPAEAVTGAQSLRRFIRRHAMRAPDAFLFTAAAQSDAWRLAGLIAPDQRVFQIPESSTRFRAIDRTAARRETGMEGIPAVLWVGRLNANKDPLTILEGFAQTLVRLPDAVLTMIYGENDLLGAVESRLRASPALASRVRLVGKVAHDLMPAFYSAADIFVLGSHHEGSGYALIEACACGLPPVVTDIPTFRMITDDGAIGALWEPGNASDFAAALVKVSRRDQEAARERGLLQFDRALSWDALARQTTAAYSEVVTFRRSLV